VVCVRLLRTIENCGGVFFFSFLVLFILNVFGYFFGVEAGCNCYLHDIDIFPLSKKYTSKR
jgi:hypothetical protein